MMQWLEKVNSVLWGVPALVLILGVGLYLSIRTGFVQLQLFFKSVREFIARMKGGKGSADGVTPYQALCTALAATVGTGNIAGVAGAMAIGGPGAIFWMWLCALLGMALKFAEATLAVRYRVRMDGELAGGPMYMILGGLSQKWKPLAVLYAFFGVVAAFGVGNATQINAVITGIHEAAAGFGGAVSRKADLTIGVILATVIAAMLLGGAKRIGKVAERLVPFAAAAYLLLGLGVILARIQLVPQAFGMILQGAFSPRAVTGGAVGSLLITLRTGVSRGVFTNEAGMGTASIAHAGALVEHPVQQGLMGIMEVFLDTVVICTMTALVILLSGVSIPYGEDVGAALTSQAFSAIYGQWVNVAIAAFLVLFAFATVLGWGLYGARCAQFLFGSGVWKRFVIFQALAVILGAVLKTQTVWLISEILNALMAIPNLIALAALSPELCRLTKEFTGTRKSVRGGIYENFHQCQSLRAVAYAEIPSFGGESPKGRQDHLSLKYRPAGSSDSEGVL